MTLSAAEGTDTCSSDTPKIARLQQGFKEPNVNDVTHPLVTFGKRLRTCVQFLGDLVRYVEAGHALRRVDLERCQFDPIGLDQFLVTDIARDGMMGGPSLALYRELRQSHPDARIQASGGIDSVAALAALRALGVAGAIIGRALLEGRFCVAEANAC